MSRLTTAAALAGALTATELPAQEVFSMSILEQDHFIDACLTDGNLVELYALSSYLTPFNAGVNAGAVEGESHITKAFTTADVDLTKSWQSLVGGYDTQTLSVSFDEFKDGLSAAFTTARNAVDPVIESYDYLAITYEPISVSVIVGAPQCALKPSN